MRSRPVIALLNGSLGGSGGNTAELLARLAGSLEPGAELRPVHLAETFATSEVKAAIDRLVPTLASSDGFVFLTGVYWDSWGSPLQLLLEQATRFEATDVWLGKPAAVLVTMHSVGGKEVLSRLQGVLSTLGLLLPPMSGMAYSLAGQLALKGCASGSDAGGFAADFWQADDLEIIAHNLLEAVRSRKERSTRWRAWPVDKQDPRRKWVSLP